MSLQCIAALPCAKAWVMSSRGSLRSDHEGSNGLTQTEDLAVRPVRTPCLFAERPVAACLAGKLTLVRCCVFCQAGQALLKPFYRRQHSGSVAELELPAAMFLPSILQSTSRRSGRVYADAFITSHGARRCANRRLDDATLSVLKAAAPQAPVSASVPRSRTGYFRRVAFPENTSTGWRAAQLIVIAVIA